MYVSRYRRGMGDAPCPSMQQLTGVVDPADPCQRSAFPLTDSSGAALCYFPDGTPAPCPDVTSVTVTASAGAPATGEFCLTPLFPFVGRRVPGAPCAGVVTIPSPWALIATVGLGALVLWKVAR